MKKDPAASADPACRAQLEFKGTVLCRGSGIAEVVERAVSKSVLSLTGTEGSNPAPSSRESEISSAHRDNRVPQR